MPLPVAYGKFCRNLFYMVRIPMKTVKSIVLHVTGMNCQHCANAVQKALSSVPGISTAEVDLSTDTAKVTGSGFDIATLIKKVEDEGYAATVSE